MRGETREQLSCLCSLTFSFSVRGSLTQGFETMRLYGNGGGDKEEVWPSRDQGGLRCCSGWEDAIPGLRPLAQAWAMLPVGG